MSDSLTGGIIDEHQARNTNEVTGSTYNPTPAEEKAIKLVNKLFSEAKKHRDMYSQSWIDFYHMFRGKQWKENRPAYRHSDVINLIFRTIQSLVPIQTDIRPRFDFLPQEPTDRELAQILSDLAENDWEKFNWAEPFLEMIYDGNIYGTGIGKLTFDPKAEFGKGAMKWETVDPLYIYPDPKARDVNKNCGYFIHAEPKSVKWIKRQHPELAEYIKPDIHDSLAEQKNATDRLKWHTVNDPMNMVTSERPDKGKSEALYIVCFINTEECSDEYEDVPVEEKDEAGNITRQYFEQRAKYPNGRKIIICNNVLLFDGPNEDVHGEFPYQRYQNYILPREFWGMSEVEQLEGPQKVFNKLVCFALDVLTLMGNPIWKIHSSNMIDTDNLTNQPGLVVEWEGEVEPKREEGVQLQPYVLQMIDRMAQWFDSIGGSNEVTRGAQPTGVTAAAAIEGLQEAAYTRVRQKARNADRMLQDLGRQYRALVFQHYETPRIVRLTNNQNVTKYFRFSTGVNEEGKPTATVTPYLKDSGAEDISGIRKFVVNGDFDTRVSTGTQLPMAKAQKEQKALALFDRQIIDAEEVLTQIDWPNKDAVLQRMQQRQEAEAQAAQAQGQPA